MALNKTAVSALAAGGLVGGYAVARRTGNRPLGGAVLGVVGAVCGTHWARTSGAARTTALVATYVGAFGASHPLAKQIGAWPAVSVVAAGTAVASQLVSR
ncbi:MULTISPECIES: hypothetical protein [unclassified Rhodococcus (in: high G+C Gram-positive bacteria)]|uniref:hypothetical protein n=1 Tax=Rhodococcus sp. SJ-3 TaxID=3454628 RepID=UPI003F7966F2